LIPVNAASRRRRWPKASVYWGLSSRQNSRPSRWHVCVEHALLPLVRIFLSATFATVIAPVIQFAAFATAPDHSSRHCGIPSTKCDNLRYELQLERAHTIGWLVVEVDKCF
jgi:hypothetical protein